MSYGVSETVEWEVTARRLEREKSRLEGRVAQLRSEVRRLASSDRGKLFAGVVSWVKDGNGRDLLYNLHQKAGLTYDELVEFFEIPRAYVENAISKIFVEKCQERQCWALEVMNAPFEVNLSGREEKILGAVIAGYKRKDISSVTGIPSNQISPAVVYLRKQGLKIHSETTLRVRKKQRRILRCLKRNPWSTSAQLIAVTGIDYSTLNTYLRKFEKSGQVVSIKPAGEFRKKYTLNEERVLGGVN